MSSTYRFPEVSIQKFNTLRLLSRFLKRYLELKLNHFCKLIAGKHNQTPLRRHAPDLITTTQGFSFVELIKGLIHLKNEYFTDFSKSQGPLASVKTFRNCSKEILFSLLDISSPQTS